MKYYIVNYILYILLLNEDQALTRLPLRMSERLVFSHPSEMSWRSAQAELAWRSRLKSGAPGREVE